MKGSGLKAPPMVHNKSRNQNKLHLESVVFFLFVCSYERIKLSQIGMRFIKKSSGKRVK